jgi:hypothetical protein
MGVWRKRMDSFKDPKWVAFVEKCKKRVADDNEEFKELGIDSIFVPQTETCPNPGYLIMGMEPTMGNKEQKIRDIDEGYVGFVHYGIDYCAYKFLCGGEFKYQLVDFCKGAMSTDDAKKTKARYKNWLPLVKEEWELLGKPQIISVGKDAYNTIYRERISWLGLKMHYILHPTMDFRITAKEKEYAHLKLNSSWPNEETQKEMIQVIEKLLESYEKLQKSDRLMNGPDGRRFHMRKDAGMEDKADYRKRILALYRRNFEDLKNKGKIEHVK